MALVVPPTLVERLRDDPDDRAALGILADWFEAHGAVEEASWLLDHVHGMAGLFRPASTGLDPLGGVDPGWLTLRNGLIVGLRVPLGKDRMAEGTARQLGRLPLALALTTVQIRDGRSASAWLPAIARHLGHVRRLQLSGDVQPAWLPDLPGLRQLEWIDLGNAEGRVALRALERLVLDVRGGASLLEVLEPASVRVLELRGQACDPERVARFARRAAVSVLEVETGGLWLAQTASDLGFGRAVSTDEGLRWTRE